MHRSARHIRALCEVQCHAEPNVDIKAPPVGGDQILITDGGPLLLCTTFDGLEGSQRLDLLRRIGTALKETLSGWTVDTECCNTGNREEDARQFDNRTSETEQCLITRGCEGYGARLKRKGIRQRASNTPEGECIGFRE